MSKYDPLCAWLTSSNALHVSLTFDQVSEILGAKLPRSAGLYTVWWANEDASETRHVQARSGWFAAGYTVRCVDRRAKSVTFERQL